MKEETRELLQRISTATISMQLLKRGFRNVCMRGVRPLDPGRARIVGEAATVRFIPMREDLASPEKLGERTNPSRRAIDGVPAGAVLVIDARGVADCAVIGDILAARIKVRGAAGVVTDGGVRDAEEVRGVGLPVFCAGPAAPASPVAHAAADAGVPIGCGGVAVLPGDVIVGDGDGVVVIPADLADEVAAGGREQEEIERFIREKVEEGRPVIGLYPPDDAVRAEYDAWRQRQKGEE